MSRQVWAMAAKCMRPRSGLAGMNGKAGRPSMELELYLEDPGESGKCPSGNTGWLSPGRLSLMAV